MHREVTSHFSDHSGALGLAFALMTLSYVGVRAEGRSIAALNLATTQVETRLIALTSGATRPIRRYVQQIREVSGSVVTCYLFAEDEKSTKMTAGSNYDDGDIMSVGHYKIALDRTGWKAPRTQNVALFSADTRGVGEFNFRRRMMYSLPGKNGVQPDILVVEQYATSTHNSRRFFFVQKEKLIPLPCKIPGQKASADTWIPGKIEPAGPLRFQSTSFVSAPEATSAADIGAYTETWVFSPERHLLLRESRKKRPDPQP